MKIFGTEEYYSQNAPYIFTMEHLIVAVIFFLIVTIVPFLMRNMKKYKIKTVLIILWIMEVLLEFFKISLKGFQDGWGSNITIFSLPIHLSSWFMYVMPFAIWGKGKVKQGAYTWLCTMSILGGILNLVIPATLYYYPITSFRGMHNMFYHAVMLFTGMLLWFTKEYKPQKSDFTLGYVPTFAASILAIAVDLSINADYMFLISGQDTPLTIISSVLPGWLYTPLIFVGYFAVSSLLIGIGHLVYYLHHKKEKAVLKAKEGT